MSAAHEVGHGVSLNWPAAITTLSAALGDRARPGAALGVHTTYRVGGAAKVLVLADSEADLAAVHEALVAAEGPVSVLVIGQGSNVLVADQGFDGVAIMLGSGLSGARGLPPAPSQLSDSRPEVTAVQIGVGGGARLPVVSRRCAAAGLHGLEWAVGIPGSVGGAVRMNAGGHGSDIAAVLAGCRVFDLGSGTASQRSPESLRLGYRSSSLGPGDVVAEAELTLRAGDRRQAEDAVAEVVRWRRVHQPGGSNAGSVFTNPADDAAGRLVEAAGLKGFRCRTAAVSDKHANFVQADPGGAADDVKAVIEHVRSEVARQLGVDLVPELHMVGFADSPDRTVEAK